MRRYLLLVVLTIILICRLYSQNGFGIGEKLEFSMWYNFIKAGYAEMSVDSLIKTRNGFAYIISYKAISTGIFEKIYKVRDYMISIVDADKFYSCGFKKNIREGSYRKNYKVDFDYVNMEARSNSDTISLNGYVNDPVSIFYYVRRLDLNPGEEYSVESFDNSKISKYKLIVSDVKTISTIFGDQNCLVIKPIGFDNKPFKYGGQAVIYLSIDKRVPVLIETSFKFGKVKMRLEKYYPSNNNNRMKME
ncbi:MAG: DUF3108 domain-containing protein [Candidatus Marinimicrobia bacterium]|nr:DUF3108 domain-containing protein [Candidatus Neomarinimicrobiota bacterium]